MINNNDYTTGNLLDFAYYEENYRLIAIDLNKLDPQQINFIGKIEGQNNGECFLSLKGQKNFYKIL